MIFRITDKTQTTGLKDYRLSCSHKFCFGAKYSGSTIRALQAYYDLNLPDIGD